MSEYPKQVTYPSFLNPLGDMLGMDIAKTHLETNEHVTRFARGDRTQLVSCLGARGELIARFMCFQEKIDYWAPPLIQSHAHKGPDIVIGQRRFDVKAFPTDTDDLKINVEAHHDPDKSMITHYWCFVIRNQVGNNRHQADYWIFSRAQVDQWQRKKVFSEFYSYPINGANT